MSNGDKQGYTIPTGGGATGPVIPGTPVTPDNASTAAQWAVDILSGDLDNKRPLGEGFQSKYKTKQSFYDKAKGYAVERDVELDAEEYLTAQGYKFIYFPYQAGEVARDIAPGLRIILKNQMASVGLIDLNNTQGSMVDEEFVKGITRLMEFSMNNKGQFDWVQSLGILRTDASVRKAAKTKAPKIENAQLDGIVEDFLAKASTRKGAPLNAEEKSYISNAIQSKIGAFNQSLGSLAPATEGKMVFDPSTPLGGTFVPGTPAQEPDFEQLAEDIEQVGEDVFAPREEAARQQQEFSETQARGNQVVADLTNLMRGGVKR
jgi:hypothetical protein